MRLKNKFAVIIGGAIGIGSAVAKVLAREGCDLLVTYHGAKEESEAIELGKNIEKFGGKFYYENLDVLKKDQIIDLFYKIKKFSDKLDIAFNNAGVSSMKIFVGLSFTMALELAKYNINVNSICPGIVVTDMIMREWKWESELRGIDEKAFVENMRQNIPLNRFAQPNDVANLVLFLASDESNYITGQAYNINGGSENH